MNTRHLLLLAFLLAFSVVAGCSNSEVPIAPGDSPDMSSRDYTSIPTYPGGHNIGSYTLMLDEISGTVELIQTDRTAEKDVTGWASVVIEGYHFDPVFSNWEIDARITNHTPFTGWGCDVVFTELADKTIVGQDGYLYIMVEGVPKRCPVVAYSKMTPQRIFPPEHSDVRKIIIHIPPDAPGLNPIQFFIDAWWPGARHEPYVEDLMIEPLPAPGMYHISAHVRDWQMPYSHQMEVKGIIPINGSDDPFVFTLYDDGEHGDGGYNDYIWGADFNFEAPTGKYLCIVKAWDPEDNSFENDIRFYHEGGPPQCEPIPHWTIDEDMHGNIELEDTWVFYHDPPFVDWWMWLKGPDIPPPPIFWQYHQVFGITLGHRPTTGYWIRIDEVCIDHDEDIIHIEYTEMVPGESCNELQIITQPFIAIGMMRWEGIPVEFHKNVEVYECPEEDCLEFELLVDGQHSGWHEKNTTVITSPYGWAQFWHVHSPYTDPPEINWAEHMIVALAMGNHPTTGYSVHLDEICWCDQGDTWRIDYTIEIPGDSCDEAQIITQPYAYYVVERADGGFTFIEHEHVYECDD